MSKLNPKAIDDLMKYCLIGDEGTTDDNLIKVEGVVNNYAFDMRKISIATSRIKELLAELPDPFHSKGSGGGWTFLNACQDRHGVLWTGSHQMVECLLCLGIASGHAKWLFPRDMWKSLPGGVPYVSVL